MQILNYDNIHENIANVHKGTIIVPIKRHGNWRKCRDITSIVLGQLRQHYMTYTFELGDIMICELKDNVYAALMCCININKQNRGITQYGFDFNAATMCLRRLYAQIHPYQYPLHVYASTFYTGSRISEAAKMLLDIDENFKTVFLHVYHDNKKEDWKWIKLRTSLRRQRHERDKSRQR